MKSIRTYLVSCHYGTGPYRKQKLKKYDIIVIKKYSILKLPYSDETYSQITID